MIVNFEKLLEEMQLLSFNSRIDTKMLVGTARHILEVKGKFFDGTEAVLTKEITCQDCYFRITSLLDRKLNK